MDASTLMLLGVFGAVGLLLLSYYLVGAGQRKLAKRAKRLGGRERSAAPVTGPQLRRDRRSGLDTFVQRLVPRPDALRARLSAAGAGMTLGRYGAICIVVAVVVAILAVVEKIAPLGALLIGMVGGLWLPHMAIGFQIKRRQGQFSKLFPEAIGLLVRGLKAGLPVAETMIVVGREVADPVGEEFRRVTDQIRLGQSVEEAMWSTARRLNLAEFNFLVITLSVQRETGGNLAETLENLDDILRKRQQMKLKIKAMSSEAVASAMIIGCLPFVMAGILFLVSRDYIMTLFHDPLGLMMVGGAVTSLLIGVGIMAKMVSFEI
jgi:tight adherence protein B